MSEHREINSHLLASTAHHQSPQPKGVSVNTVATRKDRRRKRSSTSSNGTATSTKPTPARRRSGDFKMLTTESDADCSRTAPRLTPSPTNMASVNYTKTGRVSKAKKGLKVHECDCGRSYTRAEHLRRHQRNHTQEDGVLCKYPNCGRTFVRPDLLQRHEERHNELGGNASRQPSVSSSEHSAHSAHPSPMHIPTSLTMMPVHTLPAVSYHQRQAVSPQPGPSILSRYNPTQFRTPRLPRTSKVAPAKTSHYSLQSNPAFKTPPNSNKYTQNPAFLTRNSVSSPVLIDVMATNGALAPESWAPSPYSCSSGCASPTPYPEYGNMYATPLYSAGIVRTRASSNVSLNEGNWLQASHSPTSSISLSYSWATDEKSIIASTFPYTPVSYSTTDISMYEGIGAVAHYGQYDPSDLVQLDHEEAAQLFPTVHYGMSQTARVYPFEQWLNSYWRLFHPTFPIVHRFTFAGVRASPMLCAAMSAIGAHYSNDSYNARELHDRCVKVLDKRQDMNIVGCDRLSDLQAIFLVEVFSLNFARRCARSLSMRFIAMYDQLIGPCDIDQSEITSTLLHDSIDEESVKNRWLQWVLLSARHRLLVSCYLLESRHLPTLAADQEPHLLQVVADSLPFPSHEALWEAPDARQWWTSAQEYSMMPKCIAEAAVGRIAGCYDDFQSSVLIAVIYYPSSNATLPLHAAVEHLLSDNTVTQQQFAVAKLVQLAPIRALLAVSGESWILGTKVTSQETFAAYKNTVRSWVAQLWSTTGGDYPCSAVEALRICVEILTRSLHTQEPCRLDLGNELGLFYAALVVWAATATAINGAFLVDISPQQARPSPASEAIGAPAMSPAQIQSRPTFLASTSQLTAARQVAPPGLSDRRCSIPHADIVANTVHFLSTAIENITSFDVAACQIGCTSLLLWMEMQLRCSHSNEHAATQSSQDASEHAHGDLVNENGVFDSRAHTLPRQDACYRRRGLSSHYRFVIRFLLDIPRSYFLIVAQRSASHVSASRFYIPLHVFRSTSRYPFIPSFPAIYPFLSVLAHEIPAFAFQARCGCIRLHLFISLRDFLHQRVFLVALCIQK
ncbi:uncharacterized protein M421DRAFT_90248 [Didymella exigua CBS 183.55]|uniref:C2H2-type domain-containing protein n=1 Tax=Didymella exigua CBS 183.55 TaxID=1150837 RepID=A0A6A5S0X2_9PLEO|nr:uncharacterized protein M421DRAFT_90248 [Didymella exigua CBS 183.55]KAF1931157.1 hypothetical protein M421DRAFT_90248 [Didymella exigua CBS 183.55]